ncbi:hypothetical protein POTOM_048273 [Populus tomentosa]|uniref:Uncharacterized protein n=1 Tax=Populus tomentosa TaxID=118781 RepID=A0A8X8CAF1_POPTO|nr:hypothetical protein POTOM_048273 [Populus tomentosa]
MALVIYWYDFVCFGIVAAALLVSLLMLWRRELASTCEDNILCQSLLVARSDTDDRTVLAIATPRNHVGSAQLWTSCWKGVHPGWLLATRFISFLVMAGFLLTDFLTWDATIFVYYTEWTFTLALIYFALGTVISAYGCFVSLEKPAASENGENPVFLEGDVEENGTATSKTYKEKQSRSTVRLQRHRAEEAIRERAGFWGYLMQIIYQVSHQDLLASYVHVLCIYKNRDALWPSFLAIIPLYFCLDLHLNKFSTGSTVEQNSQIKPAVLITCAGAVVLTDIVFWCVIVPFLSNTHLGLNALMGCMHSLNAFFLLLDSVLNSLPFPWFRIAYFVQWSCLYVIFQWIIHACGFTWWPYPFLELDTPWSPLWYFLVALMHIPCYGIYALIFKAKNAIFSRLFPRAFVGSF